MKIHYLALLFLLSLVSAQADTWRKAELYFTDWDKETRESWTLDKARALAENKKTIEGDLSSLISLLDLQKFISPQNPSREDTRFVVDLYTDTGTKVTYYASRANLCSADNMRKRSVDDIFLNKVRQLMKPGDRTSASSQ